MLEALLALKLHALNEAQAEAHRKEEEAKEAKKKKAKGFEPQMSKKDRKRYTTLRSIMNAKLSKQKFWHCYENGIIKTIQTIPNYL